MATLSTSATLKESMRRRAAVAGQAVAAIVKVPGDVLRLLVKPRPQVRLFSMATTRDYPDRSRACSGAPAPRGCCAARGRRGPRSRHRIAGAPRCPSPSPHQPPSSPGTLAGPRGLAAVRRAAPRRQPGHGVPAASRPRCPAGGRLPCQARGACQGATRLPALCAAYAPAGRYRSAGLLHRLVRRLSCRLGLKPSPGGRAGQVPPRPLRLCRRPGQEAGASGGDWCSRGRGHAAPRPPPIPRQPQGAGQPVPRGALRCAVLRCAALCCARA